MTKTEKEFISNEYAKVYPVNTSLHKYCVNKTSDFVVFENGMIYVFEKPSIETKFCFGYRLSSYDSEEYDAANNMVSHVKNDKGEYFKAHNLESFDNFEEFIKENELCMIPSYDGRNNSKFVTIQSVDDRRRYWGNVELILLTEKDKENLLKINSSERVKFEKRLNTYLKRYGTSKLRSWSYWSEE